MQLNNVVPTVIRIPFFKRHRTQRGLITSVELVVNNNPDNTVKKEAMLLMYRMIGTFHRVLRQVRVESVHIVGRRHNVQLNKFKASIFKRYAGRVIKSLRVNVVQIHLRISVRAVRTGKSRMFVSCLLDVNVVVDFNHLTLNFILLFRRDAGAVSHRTNMVGTPGRLSTAQVRMQYVVEFRLVMRQLHLFFLSQ